MGDLSKNFNRAEFACKGKHCCGHSAPVNPRLVTALQSLRNKLGAPLTINSGYRCNTHNVAVGGAKNSQHVYGTAADIAVSPDFTPLALYRIAEELGVFDGLGLYDWGIHVDVRGEKARWDYRTKK